MVITLVNMLVLLGLWAGATWADAQMELAKHERSVGR